MRVVIWYITMINLKPQNFFRDSSLVQTKINRYDFITIIIFYQEYSHFLIKSLFNCLYQIHINISILFSNNLSIIFSLFYLLNLLFILRLGNRGLDLAKAVSSTILKNGFTVGVFMGIGSSLRWCQLAFHLDFEKPFFLAFIDAHMQIWRYKYIFTSFLNELLFVVSTETYIYFKKMKSEFEFSGGKQNLFFRTVLDIIWKRINGKRFFLNISWSKFIFHPIDL